MLTNINISILVKTYIPLPFLSWVEREGLTPADNAIEPETGARRKTPDSLLVW